MITLIAACARRGARVVDELLTRRYFLEREFEETSDATPSPPPLTRWRARVGVFALVASVACWAVGMNLGPHYACSSIDTRVAATAAASLAAAFFASIGVSYISRFTEQRLASTIVTAVVLLAATLLALATIGSQMFSSRCACSQVFSSSCPH